MSDSNNGMYSKILVKAATFSKQKCNSPTREGRAEGSIGDTEAVVGAVVMTGKTINSKNGVFNEKSTKRNQIY